MNVNGTAIAQVIEAPDLIEKLVTGEHAVVIGSKEIKKIQFLGGQVNHLAADLKLIFLF